jgi:hypothetical protein
VGGSDSGVVGHSSEAVTFLELCDCDCDRRDLALNKEGLLDAEVVEVLDRDEDMMLVLRLCFQQWCDS